MDSNASNNIYFKPSYRTTQQGEQQGLSSAKQSLHELPQPNSNPKFSCVSVINGEAVPWNSYIRSEPQESRGSGKWRGLPKHRREGSSLALTTRMHNCLPLLFVQLQIPTPHCSLQKCHQGDGKGGQHTELGLRNSSRLTEPALKHAETYFGFAL